MSFAEIVGTRYRDRLVAASADPAAWKEALDDIAQRTRSHGAILFHRSAMPGTPVSQGAAEPMDTYWKEGWVNRDIRLRAIPVQATAGLATDEDCVTLEEMERAALYQEFLRPFGYKWFAGVGFFVRGQMWCLSIQRTPGEGAFDLSERRILRRMCGIMSDVGELNSLIAEAKISGLTSALEALGDRWFIFDEAGRRIGQGGKLTFETTRSTMEAELACRRLMDQTVEVQVRRALRSSLVEPDPVEAVVPDTEGRPITVRALRLTNLHSGFGRGQVLVVVRQPKVPAALSHDDLQRLYDLTPAEIRLANMIVSGANLPAAAAALGITYETARSQLKAVFAKCGVSRQAELILLLRR